MSLAKQIDEIFQRELEMHVAWMPISTAFSLGDYGFVRGGVFESVGNLSEFDVDIETEAGRSVSLDFVSAQARKVRMVGGARVDAFPQDSADAQLLIKFERARSVLLKCPQLVSTKISNLAVLARKLTAARRRDRSSWSPRYRVVSELFTGQDVTLISTRAANTTVEFSGRAGALRGLMSAGGSAGVSVTNAETLGLAIVGRAGPVGIDLVRFTRRGMARSAEATAPPVLECKPAGWRSDGDVEDDL